MNIPENNIEDLLYECPWLLNPNYEIAKISGTKGKGRQISLVSEFDSKPIRYIDLLMKDTIDERPIIIELKNRELKREDIGQILEYRAKCTILEPERKSEWVKEFGKKYIAPKLLLIVEKVSDELLIASSLAGVDVRTFEPISKELELNPKQDYILGLKEWKLFFEKGEIPIHQRSSWVESKRLMLEKILSKITDSDYTTITSIPKLKSKESYLGYAKYPFIDFPINQEKNNNIGFYEFDEGLPFHSEYFYCDIELFHEILRKAKQKDYLLLKEKFNKEISEIKLGSFCNSHWFLAKNDKMKIPILEVKKGVLLNEQNFTLFIESLLDFSESILEWNEISEISLGDSSSYKSFWDQFIGFFNDQVKVMQSSKISQKSTIGKRKYITNDNLINFRFRLKISPKTEQFKIGLAIYTKAKEEAKKQFYDLIENEGFKQNIKTSLENNGYKVDIHFKRRCLFFSFQKFNFKEYSVSDLKNLVEWVCNVLDTTIPKIKDQI